MEVQATINEVDEITKKIDFVVPTAQLEDAYAKKMANIVKKANIKGFRKGKAPVHVVESMYSTDIYMECVWEATDSSIKSKVKELGLKLVEAPQVTVESCSRNEDLKFSAKVTLFPEPKITAYDSIPIEVEPKKEVTEKEVEEAVEELRKRYATMEKVEGRDVVEKGDLVKVMIQILKEGDEPTKAEPYTMEIGEEKIAAGVDEQVCGMSIGEVKDVTRTVSEEEEKNGVVATVYRIEVKEILQRVLPEMNKDFYVKNGAEDVEDEDGFRTFLKGLLVEHNDDSYKSMLQEKVLDVLHEKNSFMIPNALIDFEIREMISNAMRSYGQKMEEVSDDLVAKYRDSVGDIARKRVELSIIVDQIGKAENITSTDEEVEAHYEKMASYVKVPVETYKQFFIGEGGHENAVAEVRRNKILDFLVSKAVITEKAEEK